jgi:acyl-CoA thioesterase-1
VDLDPAGVTNRAFAFSQGAECFFGRFRTEHILLAFRRMPKFCQCNPVQARNRRAILLVRLAPLVAALVLSCGIVTALAAPLNIVAVGASNTSGWGVGEQNAYPAQLQALLNAKGIDARVTNAGRAFDTTPGMLGRLATAVPQGTRIVILQPGANDLRFFGTQERRAANITAMVNQLRARKMEVIVYDEVIPPEFYAFDRIHLTIDGHRMIAAHLLPQIMDIIGRRSGDEPPKRGASARDEK